MKHVLRLIFVMLIVGYFSTLSAQMSAEEQERVAKKSSNPLSDLWLLVSQNDYSNFGGDLSDDRKVNSYKFQPVMSFGLNNGANNLIIRPVIQYQSFPTGPGNRESGFGDTILLTLYGPNRLDGLIYGFGVTQIWPTAGKDALGFEKWAVGPAALIAKLAPKPGGFNMGVLPQHWWSYAGEDGREDVSRTDLQYFLNYRWGPKRLIGTTSNITIDWKADKDNALTVPIGIGFSNIYFFGKLPIRAVLEIQYSVIKPDDFGAEWNLRLLIIPIIPRLF